MKWEKNTVIFKIINNLYYKKKNLFRLISVGFGMES